MLALKNLARRKVRTLLTVLGVSIGVATVVAMITVARGMRSQFDEFFAAGDAHLVLTRHGAADPFISYLPDSLLGELNARPEVAEAHPFIFAAHQIQAHPFFFFYGASDGSPLLAQFRVIEGRWLFEAGPERALCLGRVAAEHTGASVGSTLRMGGEDFTVSGIFESAMPLLEAGGILAFDDAQHVAGLEDKMSAALLVLRDFDPEALPQVEAALEAAFPEVEATAPGRFSNAFEEFDFAEQAVGVLTILAILVGGIGVMNTMLMSVFERTREIGVLQAIGWSRGMILRQVLGEGMLVCVVGGPVGIALGVAAVEVIGSFGELSWVGGEYAPVVFVEAMVVAVAMGLLGAGYPAVRAIRISPIEALRYE